MEKEELLDRKLITYALATYVIGYSIAWLIVSVLFLLAGIPANGLDVHLLSAGLAVIYFWLDAKREMDAYELEVIEEEIEKQKKKKD